MSKNKTLFTQDQIKDQTAYVIKCLELQLAAVFTRTPQDVLAILASQIDHAYISYPRLNDSDTIMVSILNATDDVNGTYRLASVMDSYFALIVKSIHDKQIACGGEPYSAEDFVAELQKDPVMKSKFFTASTPINIGETEQRSTCLG